MTDTSILSQTVKYNPAKEFNVDIRYIPAEQLGDVFKAALTGDPSGFLDIADMRLIDVPGYECVFRSPAHPKNLDQLFKNYQRLSSDEEPDEEERCVQLGARSMTIGDAFVIESKVIYVTPQGFAFKTEEGLVPVTEENCEV